MKKLVGFAAAVLFATTALATDNPNQEPVDVQVPVPAAAADNAEAYCASLEMETVLVEIPYCTVKGVTLGTVYMFKDLLKLPGAVLRWEADGRTTPFTSGSER